MGKKMNRRLMGLALALSVMGGCSETQEIAEDVPKVRHFTNKAIAGVSMGGGAAAQLALSQPERWDFVGILGAPLIDLQGFSRTIRRGWMGGFCSLEYLESLHASGDDLNSDNSFCGLYTERATKNLQPEQTVVPNEWLGQDALPMWEFISDYHNWWRGPNGGRGASYGRHSLINSIEDILKAYGSPLYELNPNITWAAPGVTREWLALSTQERCDNPIVNLNFYNAEYNPEGKYPVITFCDGHENDGAHSEEAVRARLTPDTARNKSQALFLAVDINSNGRRDFGEPVIHNSSERYDDFGADGIPSDLEDGYDPEVNPDPAGDDYDPFNNPSGSENNYWFDEGESYLDDGIDGVPGTGDFGEGTGGFDRAPGWAHAEKFDPHKLLQDVSAEELERLTIYMDAGIRDFLNTAIHSNRFFGELETRVGKENTRTFQDFSPLGKGLKDFDHFEPDYEKLAQYSYVRYGNVNATPYEIAQGDGNHVGTIDQVVDRAIGAFAIAQHTWPHADHEVVANPIGDTRYFGSDTYESQTLGTTQEYSYILPPGYLDPENADKRYPVLFFLHGQGQHHTDQLAYSIFTQSAMVETSTAHVAKWGKFILIYPNGRCPSGVCSSGNFWTNFANGEKNLQFYDDFYELVDLVDERYRTLDPQ
jgi:hypothetical protein